MSAYIIFNHILADTSVSNISDAISQFVSIFTTVWTFITSNWYFTALIIVPLGCLIVGSVISFIKSR